MDSNIDLQMRLFNQSISFFILLTIKFSLSNWIIFTPWFILKISNRSTFANSRISNWIIR